MEFDSLATKTHCVAAFDFDGTITTKDTFLPFLRRAFGTGKVALAFASLAWAGLEVWLGLSSRDVFKELLVARLFTAESRVRLTALGEQHALEIRNWVRPKALERINWHRARGDKLIMVSASLDLYLQPIAEALKFDALLCTQLEYQDDRLSGRLVGHNCRAAEKVVRLEQHLGKSLSEFDVYAYGDSDGDTEMLAAARYRGFMPFH